MNDKVKEALEKLYPTDPVDKKEYKDDIFMVEWPKDGELKDFYIKHFTALAVTGDTVPKFPIRFFAKVVGFEDANAETRNWGMQLNTFRGYRGYKGMSYNKSLKLKLKKILGFLYNKL